MPVHLILTKEQRIVNEYPVVDEFPADRQEGWHNAVFFAWFFKDLHIRCWLIFSNFILRILTIMHFIPGYVSTKKEHTDDDETETTEDAKDESRRLFAIDCEMVGDYFM